MIGLYIRERSTSSLSLFRWISQPRTSATMALAALALIAGRKPQNIWPFRFLAPLGLKV